MRHALVGRLAGLAVGVALVAGAAGPARAWNPFRTEHGNVEDGNELVRTGKPGDALKEYEEAREQIPERAELHYDTGLARYLLGEYGAAVKDLERALDRTDESQVELRRRILHALGTAYAAWATQAESREDEKEQAAERWEKAVHYLERTLRLAPDDTDTLRNLELALMRVDPPCSARDDEYEPNRRADEAKAVPFPEGKTELDVPLKLCPEDEDWFTVPLKRGDRLFAEITTDTPEAALALTLTAPDGKTQLRPPVDSPRPVTKISYQEGAVEGELRLRVDDTSEEEVDYHLKVRLLPACSSLEDGFEDADAAATAHVVTPQDAEAMGKLRVCPQDDDWYAADVAAGDSLVVVGTFQPEKGTPTLAITDAAGNVLVERTLPAEAAKGGAAGKEGGGAPLLVTLIEPSAGRYLVRVSGTLDVEAAYGLQVQVVPPCPAGDDGDEENDDAASAKMLEPNQSKLLRICPGDDDWFSVTAKKGERQVVVATFEHARGNLDMELWREGAAAPETTSATSSETEGGEGVPLPAVEEDTKVLVRVTGPEAASNFYLLQLQQPEGGGDKQDEQKPDEQKQDEPKPDEQKQDEPKPDQPKPDQPKPEEQRDPMQDEIEQLDQNPRNLEAERARRSSPFRHSRPAKPW